MKGNLPSVLTRFSAYIPALLLVILVGSVFGVLQGYGPENALRRFHVAAVNNDFQAMRQDAAPTATPSAIAALRNEISSIAGQGGRYSVYRIERRGSTAIAAVDYSLGGGSRVFLYVLQRSRGRWFIDPDATIALMMQKYGPPGSNQ